MRLRSPHSLTQSSTRAVVTHIDCGPSCQDALFFTNNKFSLTLLCASSVLLAFLNIKANLLFTEVFLRILGTPVMGNTESSSCLMVTTSTSGCFPMLFPPPPSLFCFQEKKLLARFVSARQVSIYFFTRNKLKLCLAMSFGRELSLETAHVRWLKHLIIIACIIDCCALHRFQICASYYTAQQIQS